MNIKIFLSILRDLFLPRERNKCPHCGGVRCIGACQFDGSAAEKTVLAEQQLPEKGGIHNEKNVCGTAANERR